jgi:hypothetical protein
MFVVHAHNDGGAFPVSEEVWLALVGMPVWELYGAVAVGVVLFLVWARVRRV